MRISSPPPDLITAGLDLEIPNGEAGEAPRAEEDRAEGREFDEGVDIDGLQGKRGLGWMKYLA